MSSSATTERPIKMRRLDAQQTKSSAVMVEEKDLNGSDFSISWTCKTGLNDFDGGGEDIYVHHFEGTLLYQKSYDDEPKNAGSVSAYKIKLHTFGNNGKDLYEHLDGMTSELESVALLIKRLQDDVDGMECKEDELVMDDEADEIIGGDVLYIDRVEVKEEFRGFNLGLFLIDRADNTLNSPMSLCLLIPCPLQHMGRRGEAFSEQEFKADREKVIKHFKRLGFKKIQYGPKLFLGRWNGYILPRLHSVCPKLFA